MGLFSGFIDGLKKSFSGERYGREIGTCLTCGNKAYFIDKCLYCGTAEVYKK